MPFRKIINDPVYGFITIDDELINQVIVHPWFQRLRRINQMAMANLVYPGAVHSRLHHALGAYHLMCNALSELKSKGIEITAEEEQAARIAILLHDAGHGPFSHALEHVLIEGMHHEKISLMIMEELNRQFDGRLHLALEIFTDHYPKKFLYQLISGQLDVDRMDYLTRDSFFTGVNEGVIGYDRILKMLDFDFFELLDSVTIARSRKHIQAFYDTSEIGPFPQRLPPQSVRMPLSDLPDVPGFNDIFVTIGIAMFPEHAPSADQLLQGAHSAVYGAKARGRNTLRYFAPEMSARGGTNVYWSANAVVDPAVMLRRFTKHAGDFNALNRPDDETIELPHIVLHEELVASWIQGNQLYEIASLLKCPYMVGVPKKKPKGPRTHIGLTNVLGKDTRAYRGLAVIEVGEKNITSIIFQGETVSDLLGVFNYFIKWVLMDGYQSED